MSGQYDEIEGIAEVAETEGDVTDETKDEELLQAVISALEMAEAAVDTEGALEEQGVEVKSARTFATRINALANEVQRERDKSVLAALAVVVSRAKPEEWPALAAILRRVAPKAVAEKAEAVASKMEAEGRVGYAEPQGYPSYPEPNESKSASDKPEIDLQAIADRVEHLAQLIEGDDGLVTAVKQIQERLGGLSGIVARETKAYLPSKTRGPDAGAIPPAAALLSQLTGV